MPRVFLILAIAWAEALFAQQNQDSGTAGVTSDRPIFEIPSSDELTADFVQEEIQKLEAALDIDEALKARIGEEHQKAMERLRATEEWKRRADEFDQARQNAPAVLEEIRAALAEPVEEPRIDVSPDESLQVLEQRLAQFEAELRAQQAELQALEDERKRRAERRLKVPEEIAAARQRLEEIVKEIAIAPPADERAELTRARRVHQAGRKKAREQELATYEKEILSYDARGELLTARRDLAARQVARREALVTAWRELVHDRRRAEAERAAREAERRRREAALAHPVVQALAEENLRIARIRTDQRLPDHIERVQAQTSSLQRELERHRSEFADVKDKIAVAGLTKEMGLLLRKNRDALPDVRQHLRNIERRQAEMAGIHFELLDAQKARDELSNLDPHVQAVLAGQDPGMDELERREIAREVRELLETRRGYWEVLKNEYDTYFHKLYALSTVERELIAVVRDYADYIREHILWVPSSSLPRFGDVLSGAAAIAWLTTTENWSEVTGALWWSVQARPVLAGVAALVFLAWFLLRHWLKRKLRALGDLARHGYPPVFEPTVFALMLTALLAGFWPALLLVLAWLLETSHDPSDFARALAGGAKVTASLLFAAELLRKLLQPRGLAEDHFEWKDRTRLLLRKHLRWAIPVIIPLVFVASVLDAQPNEAYASSLGRLAFLVSQMALAVFIQRLLRPRGGLLTDTLRQNIGGWLDRLRIFWYGGTVAAPVALAGLALFGYYYTARQLMLRLQTSVWLVVAFIIINAVLLRWILVARRKLALEQYRRRRAAMEGEHKPETEPRPLEAVAAEPAEPQIDLSAISDQTRNLVRSFVSLALLIGLWIVWVDVLPALRVLDGVVLWTTGEVTVTTAEGTLVGDLMPTTPGAAAGVVTLADLALALIVLLMTFLAGKNIPGVLEIAVLQKLPLETGVRYAITTISRYIITIVGLVIAFGAIGISWSKVQWLAAAITVGLGFGLQEIFANFVSGLIILFERPIRTGDTVTVGDVSGTVARIRIRATTIIDWDRKETVIPNKEFVTGQIINWTLTDRVLRVIIPVGVAYGSDTRLAEDTLLRVARENPRVLTEPEPRALFLGFGDSSLNFELRVFVRDIDDFITTRHELHVAIDDAFRKAGIEIAFPQRDIHVRTIRGTLPIAVNGEPAIPLPRTERGDIR